MSPHDKPPREVLLSWVKACNERDADAAASLYHDDAVNLQVADGVPVVGRQAIRDGLAYFFRAFPDNYTRPINLFVDGEWAILEWEGGGTWQNDTGTGFLGSANSGCRFSTILEAEASMLRYFVARY
jgi:hypothetical protein